MIATEVAAVEDIVEQPAEIVMAPTVVEEVPVTAEPEPTVVPVEEAVPEAEPAVAVELRSSPPKRHRSLPSPKGSQAAQDGASARGGSGGGRGGGHGRCRDFRAGCRLGGMAPAGEPVPVVEAEGGAMPPPAMPEEAPPLAAVSNGADHVADEPRRRRGQCGSGVCLERGKRDAAAAGLVEPLGALIWDVGSLSVGGSGPDGGEPLKYSYH